MHADIRESFIRVHSRTFADLFFFSAERWGFHVVEMEKPREAGVSGILK
jgi:hypothetical protein